MSHPDLNMSWRDNMDIVFGKHGWRQIPYYREGEKKMVEVPKENRDEAHSNRKVYRPWGWYDVIETGKNFQVKRLNIKPEGLDASDALAIAIAGINMWPNYSIDRKTLSTGNGLKSAIETALLKEQRR